MKITAHLFEDHETGILWMNDSRWGKTGYVETDNGKLDFAKLHAVEAEFVSMHHLGLCLASADLITVKNSNNMYSVLTPFIQSAGEGSIYASVCQGFEFKSAFAFESGEGQGMGFIYVVAENKADKWGIIRIGNSGHIWSHYSHRTYIDPRIIVNFESNSIYEVLKESNIVIPADALYHPYKREYICDLTKHNHKDFDEIGSSLADIQKARELARV